jgi:hypothetical protein
MKLLVKRLRDRAELDDQYRRLAIGTLVTEGAIRCANVTTATLNKWATAIRRAFFVAFKETWSIILVTKEQGYDCPGFWWRDVTLGGSTYDIKGVKYKSPGDSSVWNARFRDFFITEFQCQQWVSECEPVAESLTRKYQEKFGKFINVVVVRGCLAGADFIGTSFSHCGHSVWILA